MKKFFFTALALVALSGLSMAAKKTVKIVAIKKTTKVIYFDCMSTFREANNAIVEATGCTYSTAAHANAPLLYACLDKKCVTAE